MLINLIKGEFQRLTKYKILQIGLFVSCLWIVIIAFLTKEEVAEIAPLLIFTDSGMMSIILLAAMMYFEKQEGTLRTTFITPVKTWQILFAKIFASVVIGLLSTLLISLSAIIIHGSVIKLLLLLIYDIVIVTSYCTIGFLLIFISKDFNTLLVYFMLFVIVFLLPTILLMLNVIPASFEDILVISPIHSTLNLIGSTFANIEIYKIIISLLYLIVLPVILLYFFIGKRLKIFSIGG